MAQTAEADDILLGAVLLLGAYFFVTILRNRNAALAETTGGPELTPSSPSLNPGERLFDILVPMQVSPSGQGAIKQREGFTAEPENDAGHQVIGWGHDITASDNIAAPITKAEAEAIFQEDMEATAEVINSLVTVPLTQDQFDALASFEFNIGASAFRNSTLLRLLNQGNYAGAAGQFSRWDMTQGQVSSGLQSRRQGEANQFDS
jgi:lysozyme